MPHSSPVIYKNVLVIFFYLKMSLRRLFAHKLQFQQISDMHNWIQSIEKTRRYNIWWNK